MINKHYQDDQHLDILILGPMRGKDEEHSAGALVKKAVETILSEPPAKSLLQESHTTGYSVHIPDGFEEQEIVRNIFARLDITDLVIINLTPKDGPGGEPSANVYYELALIHALGLNAILLAQQGTKLPFYANTLNNTRVDSFSVEALTAVLRNPLLKFLDLKDTTDFTDNRVTQFYDDLPIVDISAAVGLATGYYYNFVGRLLRDGSFVSLYPGKINQLVIVRPTNVMDTYDQDKERLTGVLKEAGYELVNEKLDPPAGDKKGPVWIDHVKGIVIDLPRTIYPLKISPRLLSLQERLDKKNSPAAAQKRDMLLKQASERLLDRVEHAIRYHVRKQQEGYRGNLLHFTTIPRLPELLKQLGLN